MLGMADMDAHAQSEELAPVQSFVVNLPEGPDASARLSSGLEAFAARRGFRMSTAGTDVAGIGRREQIVLSRPGVRIVGETLLRESAPIAPEMAARAPRRQFDASAYRFTIRQARTGDAITTEEMDAVMSELAAALNTVGRINPMAPNP